MAPEPVRPDRGEEAEDADDADHDEQAAADDPDREPAPVAEALHLDRAGLGGPGLGRHRRPGDRGRRCGARRGRPTRSTRRRHRPSRSAARPAPAARVGLVPDGARAERDQGQQRDQRDVVAEPAELDPQHDHPDRQRAAAPTRCRNGDPPPRRRPAAAGSTAQNAAYSSAPRPLAASSTMKTDPHVRRCAARGARPGPPRRRPRSGWSGRGTGDGGGAGDPHRGLGAGVGLHASLLLSRSCHWYVVSGLHRSSHGVRRATRGSTPIPGARQSQGRLRVDA